MQSGVYITFVHGLSARIVEVIKCPVSDDEYLSYSDFVYSALANTNIQYDDFECFTNSKDAPIPENIFLRYLSQYYGHPDFNLKIKTKNILDLDDTTEKIREKGNPCEECIKRKANILEEHLVQSPQSLAVPVHRTYACIGPSLLVNSESLKAYIYKQESGANIIQEYEKTENLQKYARRKVVSFVAAYLQETFGETPSSDACVAAAKACITLFPSLKSVDDNELSLLINKTNNGFLQTKLKNNRAKRRKINHLFEATNDSQSDKIDENYDLPTIEKLIKDLQDLTFPEQLETAKIKLKATIEYRRRQSSKVEFSPFQNCSYLFFCPELVLFDFALSHVEAAQKDLKTIWQGYQSKIFTIVKKEGKTLLYTEADRENDWETLTLSVVNLLRLLGPSPNGRKKVSRLTDQQAIDRILIFKKHGLTVDEFLEGSAGRAPYVLATGESKTSISQYFAVVDSHLMPLPSYYNFIDALDMVFKLHFIFNIKYDLNLKLFWIFFEKYLYQMECSVSSVVKDVYLKLYRLQQ